MNLKHYTVSILLSTLFLFSCDGGGTPTEKSQSDGVNVTKTFGIKGDGVEIFRNPSSDAEKVKNEKASSITKTTVFATVDYTVKVKIIEESGEWSRIQVVDPAYLSESHKGWIKSSFILNNEANTKKTIELFNKPQELHEELSNNGIGQLRDWHDDGMGWFAATNYYSFGRASKENGMKNNLAYYIESPSGDYVERIKIVLNINNPSEKQEALKSLAELSHKTFQSIKLKIPKELTNSIQSGKPFKSKYKSCEVNLTKDVSKIDSWKLTISSK